MTGLVGYKWGTGLVGYNCSGDKSKVYGLIG